MLSWFGPVDGLLRTATALGSYFLIRYIQQEFGWDPPYLLAESLAVGVALAISGLASTRIWRAPSIKLVWKLGEKLVDEPTLQIRSDDPRNRRIVTHLVEMPEASLLSWLVMKTLLHESVRLHLRVVPDGIFHLSEDLSPPTIDFQPARSGFSHNIPDLNESGTVAMTRVEWEPVTLGLPVKCRVKYTLACSSMKGRVLLHLVHLDASVRAVELGH